MRAFAEQENICKAVLSGADVFVQMATGGGKSICFQVPAFLQRGVTIVVSPLQALIMDQVRELVHGKGLCCMPYYGDLGTEFLGVCREMVTAGVVRLMYVTPEAIMNDVALQSVLATHGVARIVVDEAHCMVAWGYDFRPEYARLGELRGMHVPGSRSYCTNRHGNAKHEKEHQIDVGYAK
jgi:superfamily II DNA helicase RecQ